MLVVCLRRLFSTVPTLLGIAIIVFAMTKALPGDPVELMLGNRATPEAAAQLRQDLGLDRPMPVQFGLYLTTLLQGDLGRSIVTDQPNVDIIVSRFPATFELALGAALLALLIGIPLGLLAAFKAGKWPDMLTMAGAVTGVSIPVFWLGLLLIWLFSMQLGWFPVSGRLSLDFIDYEPITHFLLIDAMLQRRWDMLLDGLHHLFLPALTLSTIPTAFLARITRASMLEVQKQDFVRTARAKGLHPLLVVFKHTLKNASLPIITVLGLQFGLLLGGAIITETIFAWPGMGTWILDSVEARDVPAISAGVLTVACAFITVNLCVDLMYRWIDPRLRL